MFKGSTSVFAALISRESWDPAHHNPKWVDSYAEAIAARREWPARKWLVGLDPKSPKEYLSHSLRNLAYEYNACLRSCNTFPEMVSFYKEMMARGVKIDVDTMYIILSRAARFPGITVEQVFLLWDEMLSHGARPDLSTTEVLQTVLTIANFEQPNMKDFLKTRATQLSRVYSALCCSEMRRLGERKCFSLLQQIFHRCRENAAALKSMLSFESYSTYISYLLKDMDRQDVLNFSRNSIDKTDERFLESIGVLHSVEGVILALRYDLHRVMGTKGHVIELKRNAEKQTAPNELYVYSMKNLLMENHATSRSIQKDITQVLVSALENATYRFGTSDSSDIKRLLFFCRSMWLDASMNGFGKDALCVIEPLMEIYKFYGKSQAARNVVNYCSRNHFLTVRILASFVATIDPWEEDIRIMTSRIVRDASARNRQKLNAASEKLESSSPSFEIYSARSLESQFNEIRKFTLKQMGVVSPFSKLDALEVPIAMLWFLRRSLEAVCDKSREGLEVYFVAFQCLEMIYCDFYDLHTSTPVKMSSFQTRSTQNCTQPLDFSLVQSSSTIGDVTDVFLYISEIIALRIEKEYVSRVVELRKRFLMSVQNDSRLLMGWLEEQ